MTRVNRVLSLLLCLALGSDALTAEPPQMLRKANHEEANVRLPDGATAAVYLTKQHTVALAKLRSDGKTWDYAKDYKAWADKTLVDSEGEVHAIFRVGRRVNEDGNRIGVDRFIDVWYARTFDGATRWGEAKMIWEGWNGTIIGKFLELPNGRLLCPSQEWVIDAPRNSPTGNNFSFVFYSDDRGETWHTSTPPITSPVYKGYNGNNYGAIEASVVPLNDGRLWMLMRTQTGYLYQSYSSDYGATWSPGEPSRFHASTGCPFHFRLPDGRIVLFWNNCEMPPRMEDGAGVYGGRDVLHAAISEDDGKTWRGFREVFRDPRRHQSPQRDGDRGTAYPYATARDDGMIELTSGQGQRFVFEVDPDWLLETEQTSDFSSGLEDWSVFTNFGPAENWWRDRTIGPDLDPEKKILRLNRDNDHAADGAVWNFPKGDRGRLTLNIQFNEGFQGAAITLNDRFFDPIDDHAETHAIFTAAVSPVGHVTDGKSVLLDRWIELALEWDVATGRCNVFADGEQVASLPMRNKTVNGVSYLHLRSLAGDQRDTAGFDVRRVHVKVSP